MALKPCVECKREISTEAKTCPHCGKKDPTGAKASPVAIGCASIVVLIFAVSLFSSSSEKSETTAGDEGGAFTSAGVASTPEPPPLPGSQWSYSNSTDEMSGKTTTSAVVSSTNTVEFDFPYQGSQHGTLMLRKHPRFGTNVIFRIEKGQLLCPSYDGCSVLVRFDEGEPTRFSAAGPSDNSSETLFISNYERFMSRLRSAKTIRISPEVYQQGNVVFTFVVEGFSPERYKGK